MSGNRRNNPPKMPANTTQEPLVSRVVAIPKETEPSTASAAKAKPKAERIGEVLRQARLDKNDDLHLIAEYLRIKPAFLIAMENSRYDEIPADAYAIGFLRTYANFLGIDGKEAVDRYRYEMAGRRKKPVLSMPTPVSEGRAPSGIIMVAATLAVLLIYALWYGLSSSNRAEVNVQPPLPTIAQAPTSSNLTPSGSSSESTAAAGLTAPVTGQQTNAATQAIPPAAPGIMVTADQGSGSTKTAGDLKTDKGLITNDSSAVSRVLIKATESSWVMVTDENGKAVFDHVMKAGEIYKVPNKPGLTMTTGNGGGIVLLLDGTELPKVANGAPHVVRNITLDPARLSNERTAPANQ